MLMSPKLASQIDDPVEWYAAIWFPSSFALVDSVRRLRSRFRRFILPRQLGSDERNPFFLLQHLGDNRDGVGRFELVTFTELANAAGRAGAARCNDQLFAVSLP